MGRARGKRPSKTMASLGEWGFIQRIRKMLPVRDAAVEYGIGDDAAVVRMRGAPSGRMLITADMMVEETHFSLSSHPPFALGRKAAAINFSDIAAMGGTPRLMLVSVGLPSKFPTKTILAIYRGMRAEARKFGCHIIGGDTVRAERLVLDVTVLGTLDAGRSPAYRSKARLGQHVYITGYPGESGAGLELLRGKRHLEKRLGSAAKRLIARHVTPTPRVREGTILSRCFPDIAMIDVSDGVYSDLSMLALASGKGMHIEFDQLPRSSALRRYCNAAGKDILRYVLFGGEDYELLFTTRSPLEEIIRTFRRHHIKTPVHRIGEVRGRGVVLLDASGNVRQFRDRTFKHFS
jgi:thiamine-monophosphate kinase